MDTVRRVDPSPEWARRAMQLAVGLVVIAAMTFGVVQLAASATGGDRCQDLLANKHRSDYISFDVEGCGASIEAATR